MLRALNDPRSVTMKSPIGRIEEANRSGSFASTILLEYIPTPRSFTGGHHLSTGNAPFKVLIIYRLSGLGYANLAMIDRRQITLLSSAAGRFTLLVGNYRLANAFRVLLRGLSGRRDHVRPIHAYENRSNNGSPANSVLNEGGLY